MSRFLNQRLGPTGLEQVFPDVPGACPLPGMGIAAVQVLDSGDF